MSEPLQIETICAQAREDAPSENRPLVAPIYQSAVWTLNSLEQCEAVYGGEVPGYIYTRDANPNHAALEQVIAKLERAAGAVVYGTGMAAIAATMTALTGNGGRLLAARQLYGASLRLLSEELTRFGVTVEWVDAAGTGSIETELAKGADVLLVETLSNPLVEVADLPTLARLCRASGTKLVVDSTFASPLVCRPLDLGADVVVHSLTKILGGHSDLTLGAAAANDPEVCAALRRHSRLWGGAANPFESWLALRGIATYPLRTERSCLNALDLARRLEAHPKVRRVYYPGLPSHPQHALANEMMPLFGAMLAFDTRDGASATSLLSRLKLLRFAPSLGDVATTVSYPVATSQRGLPAETLAEMGISGATVRLSVGIDHVDDVWADLDQALTG
jgi:cystathionine beta-lyase/cystathionine gamma-synthase